MTDGPIRETTFTDDEVKEILRRAVRTERTSVAKRGQGMSLAELESIGVEVGIDLADLEAAARSVVGERGPKPSRLLGAPRVIDRERTVSGTLSQDAFPTYLAAIRRTLGQKGEIDEVQGSLEWSATSDTSQEYVTLSPAGEGSTIHASANLSGLAVALFLPATALGGVLSVIAFAVAANNASPFGMGFALFILPTLFTLARILYGRQSAEAEERLDQVVTDLARLIEDRPDKPR